MLKTADVCAGMLATDEPLVHYRCACDFCCSLQSLAHCRGSKPPVCDILSSSVPGTLREVTRLSLAMLFSYPLQVSRERFPPQRQSRFREINKDLRRSASGLGPTARTQGKLWENSVGAKRTQVLLHQDHYSFPVFGFKAVYITEGTPALFNCKEGIHDRSHTAGWSLLVSAV